MSGLINILFRSQRKLKLRRGGEKVMKWNIHGIAVALMVSVMLVTPLIGIATAEKTTSVFIRTPGVDPPTKQEIEMIPGDRNRLSGSGNLSIASGTFRTSVYGSEEDNRGPLGYGLENVETVTSITHLVGDLVTTPAGETTTMYGYGHGIYNVTLVIESGPYGEGTLRGLEKVEWKWDLSDPNPLNWKYEFWSTSSLRQGTDDFAGINVDIEGYWNIWLGWYHTKTTVVTT